MRTPSDQVRSFDCDPGGRSRYRAATSSIGIFNSNACTVNSVSVSNPLARAGNDFTNRRLNTGTQEIMHLYGIGDHGGGPTRAMMDLGQPWTTPDVTFFKMNFGTAQSFFSDVEGRLDARDSPVWNYSTPHSLG